MFSKAEDACCVPNPSLALNHVDTDTPYDDAKPYPVVVKGSENTGHLFLVTSIITDQ